MMGMIEKETNYVNEYFPEEMRNKNVNDLSYHENVDDPVFEPFFDPPMSQTKGRNKTGRHKSGIEMATSKKKLRTCKFCGEKGANHDSRNCPTKPT